MVALSEKDSVDESDSDAVITALSGNEVLVFDGKFDESVALEVICASEDVEFEYAVDVELMCSGNVELKWILVTALICGTEEALELW